MRWLVTPANQVGLAGTDHRYLATPFRPTWVEPSAALSSTLKELHWTVAVNGGSTLLLAGLIWTRPVAMLKSDPVLQQLS